MTTALFTHPAAETHLMPVGHPEQVARYAAAISALDGLDLLWQEAELADDSEVIRCHPQRYLDRLRAALPDQGLRVLDADTHLSPGSLDAALHAVGGACAAVDSVLAGQVDNAFLAMRPPGHHAERETSMGFCLFGTVAIAAKRALDHHGLERVAVLDFDVHHGNGTQDLLWDEKRAFFASSHQMPLYPGSGTTGETGAYGQIMNMPLPPGSGGREARAAWDAILDRCREFRPELVLISAGFDSHRDDPLAQLDWLEDDFTHITQAICTMAAECTAPVVSCLEGGYDLGALGRSVRAHVEVMMEAGK